MKMKKGPTERINGTMDQVLFSRMKSMMIQDRIWEIKEFLEKLIREEWSRRGLNSETSSNVDKVCGRLIQAASPSTGTAGGQSPPRAPADPRAETIPPSKVHPKRPLKRSANHRS
jgi:hypothetical protein